MRGDTLYSHYLPQSDGQTQQVAPANAAITLTTGTAEGGGAPIASTSKAHYASRGDRRRLATAATASSSSVTTSTSATSARVGSAASTFFPRRILSRCAAALRRAARWARHTLLTTYGASMLFLLGATLLIGLLAIIIMSFYAIESAREATRITTELMTRRTEERIMGFLLLANSTAESQQFTIFCRADAPLPSDEAPWSVPDEGSYHNSTQITSSSFSYSSLGDVHGSDATTAATNGYIITDAEATAEYTTATDRRHNYFYQNDNRDRLLPGGRSGHHLARLRREEEEASDAVSISAAAPLMRRTLPPSEDPESPDTGSRRSFGRISRSSASYSAVGLGGPYSDGHSKFTKYSLNLGMVPFARYGVRFAGIAFEDGSLVGVSQFDPDDDIFTLSIIDGSYTKNGNNSSPTDDNVTSTTSSSSDTDDDGGTSNRTTTTAVPDPSSSPQPTPRPPAVKGTYRHYMSRSNGSIVSREFIRGVAHDPRQQEWYKAHGRIARPFTLSWSDATLLGSYMPSFPIVSVSYSLFNHSGFRLGTGVVTLDISALRQILTLHRPTENAHVAIVNKRGFVVSSSLSKTVVRTIVPIDRVLSEDEATLGCHFEPISDEGGEEGDEKREEEGNASTATSTTEGDDDDNATGVPTSPPTAAAAAVSAATTKIFVCFNTPQSLGYRPLAAIKEMGMLDCNRTKRLVDEKESGVIRILPGGSGPDGPHTVVVNIDRPDGGFSLIPSLTPSKSRFWVSVRSLSGAFPDLGWCLVVLIPEADALEDMREGSALFVMIFVVTCLVLVVIFMFVGRLFVLPLVDIVRKLETAEYLRDEDHNDGDSSSSASDEDDEESNKKRSPADGEKDSGGGIGRAFGLGKGSVVGGFLAAYGFIGVTADGGGGEESDASSAPPSERPDASPGGNDEEMASFVSGTVTSVDGEDADATAMLLMGATSVSAEQLKKQRRKKKGSRGKGGRKGGAAGAKEARKLSFFSDVAAIQRAYWTMADELRALKGYIPEHVCAQLLADSRPTCCGGSRSGTPTEGLWGSPADGSSGDRGGRPSPVEDSSAGGGGGASSEEKRTPRQRDVFGDVVAAAAALLGVGGGGTAAAASASEALDSPLLVASAGYAAEAPLNHQHQHNQQSLAEVAQYCPPLTDRVVVATTIPLRPTAIAASVPPNNINNTAAAGPPQQWQINSNGLPADGQFGHFQPPLTGGRGEFMAGGAPANNTAHLPQTNGCDDDGDDDDSEQQRQLLMNAAFAQAMASAAAAATNNGGGGPSYGGAFEQPPTIPLTTAENQPTASNVPIHVIPEVVEDEEEDEDERWRQINEAFLQQMAGGTAATTGATNAAGTLSPPPPFSAFPSSAPQHSSLPEQNPLQTNEVGATHGGVLGVNNSKNTSNNTSRIGEGLPRPTAEPPSLLGATDVSFAAAMTAAGGMGEITISHSRTISSLTASSSSEEGEGGTADEGAQAPTGGGGEKEREERSGKGAGERVAVDTAQQQQQQQQTNTSSFVIVGADGGLGHSFPRHSSTTAMPAPGLAAVSGTSSMATLVNLSDFEQMIMHVGGHRQPQPHPQLQQQQKRQQQPQQHHRKKQPNGHTISSGNTADGGGDGSGAGGDWVMADAPPADTVLTSQALQRQAALVSSGGRGVIGNLPHPLAAPPSPQLLQYNSQPSPPPPQWNANSGGRGTLVERHIAVAVVNIVGFHAHAEHTASSSAVVTAMLLGAGGGSPPLRATGPNNPSSPHSPTNPTSAADATAKLVRDHEAVVAYIHEAARRCGGVLDTFAGDKFWVSFNATLAVPPRRERAHKHQQQRRRIAAAGGSGSCGGSSSSAAVPSASSEGERSRRRAANGSFTTSSSSNATAGCDFTDESADPSAPVFVRDDGSCEDDVVQQRRGGDGDDAADDSDGCDGPVAKALAAANSTAAAAIASANSSLHVAQIAAALFACEVCNTINSDANRWHSTKNAGGNGGGGGRAGGGGGGGAAGPEECGANSTSPSRPPLAPRPPRFPCALRGVTVGVATGKAFIGAMGTTRIRRHTIISTAMPQAAALERLAARYPDCGVMVGGDMIPAIEGYFQYLVVDAVALPGSNGKRRRIASVRAPMQPPLPSLSSAAGGVHHSSDAPAGSRSCAAPSFPSRLLPIAHRFGRPLPTHNPFAEANACFNAFLEGRAHDVIGLLGQMDARIAESIAAAGGGSVGVSNNSPTSSSGPLLTAPHHPPLSPAEAHAVRALQQYIVRLAGSVDGRLYANPIGTAFQ